MQIQKIQMKGGPWESNDTNLAKEFSKTVQKYKGKKSINRKYQETCAYCVASPASNYQWNQLEGQTQLLSVFTW